MDRTLGSGCKNKIVTMINKSIYLFPDPNTAGVAEIGGKGLSLLLGSQEKLPVPPGFILSVSFFTPWFQELKKTKAWTEFLKSKKETREKSCLALKQEALHLSFTIQQEQELLEALKNYPKERLFAVRSSSPEEDLESSSFAGGYETILGITIPQIKSAIKKAFTSCLDYRVTVYKQENGFDITNPQIAVIIQEQIASEVAGVGFSLNPVTNNYDEAVFTANWGLGETVVAGTATPDTYIMDKVLLKLKDKQLGKKQTAIYLTPTGGTKEKQENRNNLFTLSDSQVLELTELIKKVETVYKKPIDIEWAYAQEKLYLLQARPITTYIPLSPEMITQPGEKKRLYIDLATTLQGLYQPISITGTSFFTHVIRKIGKILFFRDITTDINQAIPWIAPGRIYLNVSNVLKLVDKKKLANFINIIDPLTAKTIQNTNEKEYISDTEKLLLIPFGIMRKLPRIISQIFKARMWPEKTYLQSQQRLLFFAQKARKLANTQDSLTVLTDKLVTALIDEVMLNTVPLFITGKIALAEMKKLAGKDLQHAFAPLEVALPNNVTTQMGLELFHISQTLPLNVNQKEIEEGIKQKTLPKAFMTAWEKFLNTYGHRGPLEIDIAAPRYQDNPKLLIAILHSMQSNQTDNPEEKFKKNQQESHNAYEFINKEIQKRHNTQAKKFQRQYKIFETFAGLRESHKLYLAFVTDLLRQKIVEQAQSLYNAGRLESIEQVFDLTLEELDKAKNNSSFNLIETAKKNRKSINRLMHITNPPSVIDSRGLIHRPPTQPAQKDEVAGTPISPGIIRGHIKVLHTPDEKPLLKGEILVARATDPGWTPLFVNAGAVILEIGGVLQHGALVAREYGLPCVAGVENATTRWKDGTLVEVDGSQGVIRLVK